MRALALFTVVILLSGCATPPSDQDPTQAPDPSSATGPSMGWNYLGIFPDSAVNIATFQLPDGRYVAYYTSTTSASARGVPHRAISSDGLVWTVDASWNCNVFCDILDGLPSMPHIKFLKLEDGRFRGYVKTIGERSVRSFVSADGLAWATEEGTRFQGDAGQEYEAGMATLIDFYPVRLPDGRVRAYYQGSKVPANGEGCGSCYVILSAISTDDGWTFTREPGIRLDPRPWNQTYDYGGWGFADAKVLVTDEGFEAFVGNYAGPVTVASSKDGLEFEFEGFAPLWGFNAEVLPLSDGRKLLLGGSGGGPGSAMCPGPEGCHRYYHLVHMLLWESLPAAIAADPWDNAKHSTTVHVDGVPAKPARLRVIDGSGMYCPWDEQNQTNVWNEGCFFHPELYEFSPESGNVPYTAVLTREVSPLESEDTVLVGVEVDGKTIAVTILCINRSPSYPNCGT